MRRGIRRLGYNDDGNGMAEILIMPFQPRAIQFILETSGCEISCAQPYA
jgi:hypothetical protein